MNILGRFGRRLVPLPTGRRAGPVARRVRIAAVCAGLVIGLASCTNGYSGGLSSGSVYGGSRYHDYPYYDPYSRYDRGPVFYYGNPLYGPFYDDDWDDDGDDDGRVKRRHKHNKWWNNLSDQERARIKAHEKKREPEFLWKPRKKRR